MMSSTGVLSAGVVAACVSFFLSILIVLTQKLHGRLSLDVDLSGAQKFHKTPVPRIGGMALSIALLAALLYQALDYPKPPSEGGTGKILLLLLAGVPAFITGLIEDITKRTSVKSRLAATFASALLASWLVDASLPRVDVSAIDYVFATLPFVAVAFTAFAVAGVANSINIIDGFHGLAATTVVIILGGLGMLSWSAGDYFVLKIIAVGIGATLGFFLINFPTGRLFMGDGGAYLLGFWVAEVAVLLIVRNPSINAWQVLAICSYPIIEVLYSMYRKKVIRKMSPGLPDRLHLHMLIYRRLVWRFIPRNDSKPWVRNAAVSCVTAVWIGGMTVIAVIFGSDAPALVVLANVAIYITVYTRLVRGRWRLNPVLALGIRPDSAVKEAR
ncbi:MraY family glycosyltransferase [Noviherbaspirillum sp. Root189]|uniref:MraY family glycosyltransferase n=1 Tax=Noviherbaspirillum sp. Root189 TaxID=1736487 RepID=UPI0009EC1ECF|nr:glycosyltransferase [Noviherbaspirillum sp. Root189]